LDEKTKQWIEEALGIAAEADSNSQLVLIRCETAVVTNATDSEVIRELGMALFGGYAEEGGGVPE
jgi:hypothetical protein